MIISPLPTSTKPPQPLLLPAGSTRLLLEAGKQKMPTVAKVGLAVTAAFIAFTQHLVRNSRPQFSLMSEEERLAYVQAFGPEK